MGARKGTGVVPIFMDCPLCAGRERGPGGTERERGREHSTQLTLSRSRISEEERLPGGGARKWGRCLGKGVSGGGTRGEPSREGGRGRRLESQFGAGLEFAVCLLPGFRSRGLKRGGRGQAPGPSEEEPVVTGGLPPLLRVSQLPQKLLPCCASQQPPPGPGLAEVSGPGSFLAPSAPPYVPVFLASGCRELLFPAASVLAVGVAGRAASIFCVLVLVRVQPAGVQSWGQRCVCRLPSAGPGLALGAECGIWPWLRVTVVPLQGSVHPPSPRSSSS